MPKLQDVLVYASCSLGLRPCGAGYRNIDVLGKRSHVWFYHSRPETPGHSGVLANLNHPDNAASSYWKRIALGITAAIFKGQPVNHIPIAFNVSTNPHASGMMDEL